MKFGRGLKIASAILLLQGLFVILLVFIGDVTATGVSKGMVTVAFLTFALAEIGISIGLFRSQVWALWGAGVLSVVGGYVNLSNLISKDEKDLWAAFFALLFGYLLWQACSHIIRIKRRSQSSA